MHGGGGPPLLSSSRLSPHQVLLFYCVPTVFPSKFSSAGRFRTQLVSHRLGRFRVRQLIIRVALTSRVVTGSLLYSSRSLWALTVTLTCCLSPPPLFTTTALESVPLARSHLINSSIERVQTPSAITVVEVCLPFSLVTLSSYQGSIRGVASYQPSSVLGVGVVLSSSNISKLNQILYKGRDEKPCTVICNVKRENVRYNCSVMPRVQKDNKTPWSMEQACLE